jgi:hypothetical protein
MLVDAFKTTIFPYVIQVGVILFVFSIASNAYSLFRTPNWQQFIDKMKAALLAYACIKGAFAIVSFIDKIISGIKL